jgi:hypothetical protein
LVLGSNAGFWSAAVSLPFFFFMVTSASPEANPFDIDCCKKQPLPHNFGANTNHLESTLAKAKIYLTHQKPSASLEV